MVLAFWLHLLTNRGCNNNWNKMSTRHHQKCEKKNTKKVARDEKLAQPLKFNFDISNCWLKTSTSPTWKKKLNWICVNLIYLIRVKYSLANFFLNHFDTVHKLVMEISAQKKHKLCRWVRFGWRRRRVWFGVVKVKSSVELMWMLSKSNVTHDRYWSHSRWSFRLKLLLKSCLICYNAKCNLL